MAKTTPELLSETDTSLPDNITGQITPAQLRALVKDIIQNEHPTALQLSTASGTPTSSTFLRGDNTWATPTPGGGTFTGTGDPGLTRAQHAVTTYSTPPNVIRTSGYDDPGDWGGAMYVKVNAQPDHKGWFQTADNTYYELYPEDGYVTPQMFGGKATAVYTDRFPDIGPACNDAVDYIIFNRFGKVDLHLRGALFLATTVQMKGGSFNVRGHTGPGTGATYIMTDYYTTGFVAHHGSYSFEAFGSVYYYNRQVSVGETVYNGNVLGNHAYICVTAGTTSADGSQKPTGTGNGQTDGTVVWDYYREATRVELTGTAWGGEFSQIVLYSHYGDTTAGGSWLAQTHAPAVGPWSQKSSGLYNTAGPWKPAFGFLGRARGHVHHCWMGGFSATGCAFIANGDLDFPTISGNVNGWAISDCAFYYNSMDGMHNSYSDGNAGYASHIDVASNGRWGYYNQGFLGDGIFQIQSAYDGKAFSAGNQRFPISVAHAGYYYYARMGQLGTSGMPNYGAVAPTPGASNSAWSLAGGDGTWASDNWNFPEWVSGNTYEPGGAFASNNINARHTWIQCYIEGGTAPAQFNSRDVQIGGLMQGLFIGAGSNMLQDGNWHNPINYSSRAHNFQASLGSGGTYGIGEGVLLWTDTSGNEYTLRTDSYENDGATYATDNYAWCINRSRFGYWIKNGQTSKFYGRSTVVPGGSFAFHTLFVGSDGDCRQIDFADSVGAITGPHGRGDVVKNRSAAVGQPKEWICTVAGNPGTFVSGGNL